MTLEIETTRAIAAQILRHRSFTFQEFSQRYAQSNENYAGLLRYCIKHNHWSVFEQSSMTLEIETTRAIAAQILRHRSFTFQEFSQRYAQSNELGNIKLPDLRRQDKKNRQNSIDDLDPFIKQKLEAQMITLFSSAQSLYNQMIEEGVAKECARMVLPLCTPTRIYMTGSCRSWIHYIDLRTAHGTQRNTWTLQRHVDLFLSSSFL